MASTGVKLIDECRGVDCVVIGALILVLILLAVSYWFGYQFMTKRAPQQVVINTAPAATPQVAVATPTAAVVAPAGSGAKECMAPNPFGPDPTVAALARMQYKGDPRSSVAVVGRYGRERMGNENKSLTGLLY
jgi:hypothetical protein